MMSSEQNLFQGMQKAFSQLTDILEMVVSQSSPTYSRE